MTMENDNLPVIAEPRSVVSASDFEAAIEDGKKKAVMLKSIVEQQGLFANIQGKKYLEVEAWETIGRAYGYTAKTDWTRPVEGGGWEARAVVIDPYGVEVGAAETECGTAGDSPWDKRPSNVQRSMAQTRAVSKSLRSILSWVVVLAGYSPTPANELPSEVKEADPSNVCPVHGLEWKQSEKQKKAGYSPSHPIVEDGVTVAWCNKSDVEKQGVAMVKPHWSEEAFDPERDRPATREELAEVGEFADGLGLDPDKGRTALKDARGAAPQYTIGHVIDAKKKLSEMALETVGAPVEEGDG